MGPPSRAVPLFLLQGLAEEGCAEFGKDCGEAVGDQQGESLNMEEGVPVDVFPLITPSPWVGKLG